MSSNKTNNLVAFEDTENTACAGTAELHGVGEFNREFKIITDKIKRWGIGKLYEIVDGVVPDINSVQPTMRTPSYRESEQDERIQCKCVKTGKLFLFVGTMKKNVPCAATPKLCVKAVVPLTAATKYVAHIVSDPVEMLGEADPLVSAENTGGEMSNPKIPSRRQRDQEAYLRMLQSIAAQREAGLDPDVCMAFITGFVNESRATLYRKMGKTFPPPLKRGYSNFWPLSQIEAYKAKSYRYVKEITSPKLPKVNAETIANSSCAPV